MKHLILFLVQTQSLDIRNVKPERKIAGERTVTP